MGAQQYVHQVEENKVLNMQSLYLMLCLFCLLWFFLFVYYLCYLQKSVQLNKMNL